MPQPALIDAHCHLDFECFDEDREQVIQRAKDKNISDIIIPGTQQKFWQRIKNLCATSKHLHACYGIHPYWLSEHDEHSIKNLGNYIENNHPVALGECGLDFRAQYADKKTQLVFFEAQLAIAQSNQLPIVIHSVRATETVIHTIKKFKNLRGMVHSFSGSSEQAKQLIDLNFLISIGGSVTYDNAIKIKSTVREIPLTSLLLETDAPDQADKTNKKSRNEPAYLANTLGVIARLRNVPTEVIANQTTENAKSLFGI